MGVNKSNQDLNKKIIIKVDSHVPTNVFKRYTSSCIVRIKIAYARKIGYLCSKKPWDRWW
jgi:hypothetical protein